MSSEEIVASITWHYMCADRLTGTQLQEHERRGACPACEHGIPLVLLASDGQPVSSPAGT